MEEGIDVFKGWGEEARRKCDRLIPDGFESDPVKTFEYLGSAKSESTKLLESVLRKGSDVLKWWLQKVWGRKYRHLGKFMPRLPVGIAEEEDKNQQIGPEE